MEITTNQKKLELIDKLIKEGHVTFQEGIMLSEKEVEFISIPQQPYLPTPPWTLPPVMYYITKTSDRTEFIN